MAREDHEHICFVYSLASVVGKNPKSPKLSPMADNAITQGSKGGLGSLVYICEKNSNLIFAPFWKRT